MRIPLSWLAEYVDVPADHGPHDVAADLVRVGLEEEDFIESEITGPLVVGEVLTKEPEPQKNGKVINWCSLDVGRGSDDPQWIICGAHNFEVGHKVVVAMPGAVLPGNFAITPRKTYGHVSNGMICSSAELGLGDGGDGIIVLSEWGHDTVSAGDDALAILGLSGRDAQAVELNITPDRGYCFSVRGVAREYAHARGLSTDKAFKDPAQIATATADGDGFEVNLDDAGGLGLGVGCPRFTAHVVRGVDGGAATPQWMQRRLTLAGMRPISLVVDITNYVMLGLGQPMHAYDLATLDQAHGLFVRRAKTGEVLTTLDGNERALHEQDLVIADGEGGSRVIGIAGVMGGAATEVSDKTTDILLESAWFDPISVARSARRHKLPSEASKRFERGVDTQLQPAALALAVKLLEELGGGKADHSCTDVGVPVPGAAFTMAADHPTRVVGREIESGRVAEILREIGCSVEERGDELTIVPPSWRPDVATAIDAVEEVARIDGYDLIPSVMPVAPVGHGLTYGQRVRRLVAGHLAARGLTEVLGYPFTSTERFDALVFPEDDARRGAVALANPLSAEAPLLRPDLLCTLPDALVRNISRGAENVALFEMGQVSLPRTSQEHLPVVSAESRPSDETLDALNAGLPPQPVRVAGILSGDIDAAGWQGEGRAADWADAIELLRSLIELLGGTPRVVAAEHAPFHPGRCAEVFLGETHIGYAGELHPDAVAALRLPTRTVAFEADVDALVQATTGTPFAKTLSTYPVVKEDIALIVGEDVSAADVEAALVEGGGELLESVRLFDVYRGDKLGDGKKSLAFALRMRASNRTMNAEEAARTRGAAVAVAAERFGAVLRDS